MNRIYRIVWNDGLAACVAASECARGRGRRTGACIGAIALSLLSAAAYALPVGGQISVGQGSIGGTGSAMTVTQQSQNLAINWQSFGIGANESVNFAQPNASAIALNRVLGADASQIYGKLTANGQVWLLNPNGVLFGSTAQVNVGGLVASTLNISDADFLAGKRTFAGSGGTVVNQGSITAADGGYVAMLGGRVSNEGVIQARLGTVALGAGSEVTLDFAGDKLLSLQVDAGIVDALAENRQLIQADGGAVLLSARAADALVGTVVNNAGIIEARTIDASSGTIRLVGGKEGGIVEVGGTLDASAPNGGSGGFIETSGAQVKVADEAVVTTAAPAGTTGTWLIDPVDFNIAASGGDIRGSTLAGQLNTTNVTILSSQGSTPGVGDINVSDAVMWDSENSLTLSAWHSVNVNQPISNACTGSVTLRADNTGACVAGTAGCGTVNFSGAGHVTLNGGALDIYYNPTGRSNGAGDNGNGPSYATPTAYSGDATLNDGGTLTAWMLVNDVNQLQAINTNLGGNYALGRDIDASATAGWNGGAGFVPVGYNLAPFTGAFYGGGHTIAGLTIDRPSTNWIGLFGASSGTLRDVNLADVSITGYMFVGALAGWAPGTISGSSSSGNVSGYGSVGGLVGATDIGSLVTHSSSSADVIGIDPDGVNIGGLVGLLYQSELADSWASGSVSGARLVGGLVGINYGGTIANSYATGNVSGSLSYAGGLVGLNGTTGTITDAYATGNITAWGAGGLVGQNLGTIQGSHATGAIRFSTSLAGGLVADNRGTVRDSYATGVVQSFVDYLGGLAGSNSGTLSNVFATGDVVGDSAGPGAFTPPSTGAGGLVGYNTGTIDHAYATGRVHGAIMSGGLVGRNAGTISSSFATGEVAFSALEGGLVGDNEGSIRNAFATGSVYAPLYSAAGLQLQGGLVGLNSGTIETSYSIGAVIGTTNVGGLVGKNSGSVIDGYWDITTSGQTSSDGGTGLTDKQMKHRKYFVGFDFVNIWTIQQGRGYPTLQAF